jgi:hypothetical protein
MTLIHSRPRCRNEELATAHKNIAVASLQAFRRECNRIGKLASLNKVDSAEALDAMLIAARSHGLQGAYGSSFIADVITDAFETGERR